MAAVVLLLAFAALAAGGVLVARACMRAVRRHVERLQWDDLVTRHRELDRRLESTWPHG